MNKNFVHLEVLHLETLNCNLLPETLNLMLEQPLQLEVPIKRTKIKIVIPYLYVLHDSFRIIRFGKYFSKQFPKVIGSSPGAPPSFSAVAFILKKTLLCSKPYLYAKRFTTIRNRKKSCPARFFLGAKPRTKNAILISSSISRCSIIPEWFFIVSRLLISFCHIILYHLLWRK